MSPPQKHPPIPPPGLLLTYLAGTEGAAVDSSVSADSPRLLLWSAALDRWLLLRDKNCRQASNLPVRAVWKRWLSRCPKMPWQVVAQDVAGYAAWMRLQGYAAATIAYDLSTLSSFYRWCAQHAIDPACPSAFNPLDGVPRPKRQLYSHAQVLTSFEARRLLDIFLLDGSLLSLRDHAFFLARLRLGVEISLLLQLQWRQLSQDQTAPSVRWKKGARKSSFPQDVWDAVERYLKTSGRWDAMRPASYIFAPLADALRQDPTGSASDWNDARFLSLSQAKEILKTYGRLAGIPDHKTTLNCLRHTAVMLHVQAGATIQQIHKFRGGKTLKATQSYLRAMTPVWAAAQAEAALADISAQANTSALSVVAPQGDVGSQPSDAALPPKEQLPQRTTKIFKEGHGLTHGANASRQPPEQMAAMLKAIQAEEVVGLEDEICGLREVGRRLLAMHVQAGSGRQEAQLGEAYTAAAQRLGGLVEAERKLAEKRRASQGAGGLLASWDEMAVKEGWEVLPSEEVRKVAAQEIAGTSRRLDEEVAAVRLVLRRTLALVMASQDPAELIRLAEIYGTGCLRLVRLLKVEGAAESQLENILTDMILQGLREAHDDLFGREDDGRLV